ncbi:MAG: threonylcarbamoyl-AMP synthase [Nitriliruptorales bacterium]|nr:threonylcarbamoyl-AMP synthase [Nitriliruptorales bacterium]
MPRVNGPRVLRVDVLRPTPGALDEGAAALRSGQLVAFPTETVYGLGANACSAPAVERIFAVKQRPADNPLIVHVHSLEAAAEVTARITPLARELAGRWWPGPLTLVLEADPGLPDVTTGGLSTVAVRMPGHPLALALLRAAELPVAAPSANRSGRPSPTTAQHVVAELGTGVDLILDGGPCSVGVESTVVDARGERPIVLREGAVSREHLGLGTDDAQEGDVRASPGTRYRHYAPACAVELVAAGDGVARASRLAQQGRRVGLIGFTAAHPPTRTVAVVRDAADLAQRLYGALRDAEAAGLEMVVVEAVEEVGIGRAVMDRLRRAAAG